MFGCCGADRIKFKDKDFQVDPKRLENLETEKKAYGWSLSQIERAKACTCPCHVDGCFVMC